MSADEIIRELRTLLGRYSGEERELLDRLDEEAEGWKMRLEELDEMEEDEP